MMPNVKNYRFLFQKRQVLRIEPRGWDRWGVHRRWMDGLAVGSGNRGGEGEKEECSRRRSLE